MQEIISDKNWNKLGIYPIVDEHDIVKVRSIVRQHAKDFRMGIVEQTRITTAISELLRNMYNYANGGDVVIESGDIEEHNALIITCIDKGPGIENVELAMSDGYTSGMGMGYGLPGAKRLVDKFEIYSEPQKGTTVRIMKWK
ncbi:anti-sigma regulatory factor [Maribellus maritimus]|uniref:anti-sigma regulatory factor n=1 Tax=Maribellus maritimus TaxID=2870838 RepID=UPI001EEA4B44|nr:anti-sigma regulatory factor [Maribellus maritimus]MCG6188270.1 anti-sigma regulatory factor [Maribellus maritimus]